jgi:hypothetical protein
VSVSQAPPLLSLNLPISTNPLFDDLEIFSANGFVDNVTSILNPVRGMTTPRGFEIFLGTFTYTANAAGVVVLTADDFARGTDQTVSAQGQPLDSLIAKGEARVTIGSETGAVPEPATLVLLGVGLVGVCGYRLCHRVASRYP